MKKKRIFLILIGVVAIAAYFGYNYIYQEHRDIKSETSQLEIAAPFLLERFRKNDAADLLNRTITVTGAITSRDESSVTLDESVQAIFESENVVFKKNEKVKIKGRCIGYDELFNIVKLDQCSFIK